MVYSAIPKKMISSYNAQITVLLIFKWLIHDHTIDMHASDNLELVLKKLVNF